MSSIDFFNTHTILNKIKIINTISFPYNFWKQCHSTTFYMACFTFHKLKWFFHPKILVLWQSYKTTYFHQHNYDWLSRHQPWVHYQHMNDWLVTETSLTSTNIIMIGYQDITLEYITNTWMIDWSSRHQLLFGHLHLDRKK